MEKNINTRELITDMLTEIYAKREYSHVLIKNILNKYNYLEESDKAFIKRVTEGTLERGIQIDYVLNAYSKVPVNKMKPFIRSLLRMSVYQILFMDKVPDSAACNEAVKLAGKRNFHNLKGFVNGVLRNVARQKDNISYPDLAADPLQAICIRYSMPKLLTSMMIQQYGVEKTKEIFAKLLEERNLCVRMKEQITKEEKEAVLREWEEKNITFHVHPWLSYAYVIKGTERLSDLAGFQNGSYTVQDVSSMMVCEIAQIRKNDYVMDVCAAPGGKSLHACDKLNDTGIVDARDVTAYKTELILQNKERMHADNLHVKVWDATKKDETAIGKADVLLLDIPCSGIGVIGKKPDIKYRLTEESLESLAVLQKEIIDTVWEYVKPGGTLIYSTCTIRREENEDMVAYITQKYPFETESVKPYVPECLQDAEIKEGCLLLLPSDQSDGFFMARLKRK
ncbi:MAG: 16S rRNA (cytosine(967)-C(5))-methyltransferase RsmB [Lachnospiraceae bacterium]|nr:16S rRNA (cytosine(967)-C(5))-methyltransferase RsmB [Lachnospiraceae bacterium]